MHEENLLLDAILACDVGTIANIIQAARELHGDNLYVRLSKAYYELTNKDPGADTDRINLR